MASPLNIRIMTLMSIVAKRSGAKNPLRNNRYSGWMSIVGPNNGLAIEY